jgi:hypothetical protein
MEDQLQRVIDTDTSPEPAEEAYGPQMPFATSYVLTRDQEDELIEHAMCRLQELEQETGRDRTGKGDWWMNGGVQPIETDPQGINRADRTWMGKRCLYDLVYDNNVDHRAIVLGGIFAESNLVVPLARRITRQMTARAVNYYFSTDPWYAAYPVGEFDRERADKADRYTRWKTDQSKLKRTLEQGIERAFVLGESVVKTTWKRREQIYKTTAEVLVDAEGLDILAADGDYILESDEWITREVQDASNPEQMIADAVMVLKRDGKTPKPSELTFVSKAITRRMTHYNGPESKVIHFGDFLCPLKTASIQEADCVIHLYDVPVMELADQWKKDDEGMGAADDEEAIRKAITLIREISSSSNNTPTAQDSDKPGEDDGRDQVNSAAMVSIAEFHLRYDADGDGLMEEIMLVVDRNSKTPIFYDYEANVTPDGLRSFDAIRVNEIPGRWYGMGAMEMFETTQRFVDLTANRWNLSQSRAARVDFWKPQNTIEGRLNPHLGLNWGGTYTPLGDKTAKDCLESVYLEDNKGMDLKLMIEFFSQLAMNESGVQHANDAQAAGFDSAKLATGIRNIEKSGQEMFSLYLGHLEPGITGTLTRHVKLLMVNLDQMEVYHYFEDDENGEGAAGLVAIEPGEIANMELDVRILLTRYRGEQTLESSMSAVGLINQYYAQPFPIQQRTVLMFRDMLKALQIPYSDRVIQPLALMPPGPAGTSPSQLAAAGASPPRIAAPNL